jgi:8-oxo-dGTP diphosphatase
MVSEYLPVVAAVIYRDQNLLLARRKSGKSLAGYWEFPGGKIENGETPEKALARELYEEFDVVVSVGKEIATHRHDYEHIKIELIAHETRIESGELELRDHDAIVWVTPHEARHYKLAPADIPILEHILQTQA